MAQILVRQIDAADLETLRARARAQKTSVESLARAAIRTAAKLTGEERRALVREMREWSRQAQIPGVPQTLGVDLIREARDE